MSDKQRLQVNNTNLSGFLSEIGDLPLKSLVEAAAREGQYVWKKLTAEGGTFLDYVVNDSESAYPDGGTKDGYWYERVSEFDYASIYGCTKYSIDKITIATATTDITINHSLGETPIFAELVTPDIYAYSELFPTRVTYRRNNVNDTAGTYLYRSDDNTGKIYEYLRTTGGTMVLKSDTVRVYNLNYNLPVGIEYTLITMA